LNNDLDMAQYMARVLDAEKKTITSEDEFLGVVPWFSGTKAVQSLQEWKNKIRSKQWIVDIPEPSFVQNGDSTEMAWSALWDKMMDKHNQSDKELKIVFEPSTLGLRVEWHSGRVANVYDGGQADIFGVRPGMFFRSVAGKPFTKALLQAAIDGSTNYEVAFTEEYAGEEEQTSSEDIFYVLRDPNRKRWKKFKQR